MKKRTKILAVLLTVVLTLGIVPVTALAASYPLIYVDTFESTPTIPEGEMGQVVFTIFPEYKNERYNVELYDSDGYKVGNVSSTYYNSSIMYRNVTINIDTHDLELEVGKYTVKYWLDFYTFSSWHSAPNQYTTYFEVIPNTCYGNHNLSLYRVAMEGDCDTEGVNEMRCTKCQYRGYVNSGKGEHTWEWEQNNDTTHLCVCSECDEEKTENHKWTITLNTFPTFTDTGIADYTCEYCDYTKQVDIETLQNGWNWVCGKWYICEDQAIVKNAWRQDSKGWVYLGYDGAMKTNAWVRDSIGWCFVGADGYAVTNCWKKDSVGWCYLNASGSMVKNNWVLDGGKWYFLNAEGYMVTNQWKKDSIGWCFLGADGAMKTNAWVRDTHGWCFVGYNGYCVTNQWKQDSSGKWCYLNSAGNMVVNAWVKSGGKWYYMDGNGYMLANTSRYIKNKTYHFNANGVCRNP